MDVTIETQAPPLKKWADGSIRIANTRVTFDTLIAFYKQGQKAEDLHEGFPTLSLADIHATIAYYLNHKEQMEAYLSERAQAAQKVRAEMEAQFPPEGIRDRLLDRLSKNS